ncbi:hypothetical protein [Hyalangium sp.]|uniref:hypothetical protein n=1 Tax=Hyalangium sp. TaxID=2028555 RepID=UPI002D3DD1D7|nr:hypothetical protein [Hyalangium sp.]HYH94611.1 hypothetical protein [Hyalangium sp.]
MVRILRALLFMAVLPVGLACEQVKQIDPPDLPKVDLPNLSLPKRGTGNFVLLENPLGGLQLDPRGDDAITALGACTDLITYCFEPGQRSVDECVPAVPLCKTSKPWEEDDCCPSACVDAYAKARDRGQEAFTAFEQTFFVEPDCFPGVRALLEDQ